MKKKFLVAASVAASLMGMGFAAPAQAAEAPVYFSRIQYDSPGKDTRSNASLNAEWFRLSNSTKKAIQLKGFTVRDASSHVYTFTAYVLNPGKSVVVRTGKGTNGKPAATDRYWGSGNYVWNNTGDTATLRSATGKVINTCKFKKGTATNC
ncbi:lamin tail domain-containing protein [Actinoplanes sp. TRM 88003]|uniref:Lamin tail domain-containing protein n=1 Tax=Paractinoplanes aksuensis TaxID=2939490 RepID=A0ABT1DVG1_9ACTN|nr:lamin tail domain-containing protein [Actinoplanes aksuensis]MCO8274854.1 lamin tail domain-containing protein [Actinoplanes aksuensis]